MDHDDGFNEIEAEFPDEILQYGQVEDQQQNEPSVNVFNALNGLRRRPPKRIYEDDDCDALDWHMRVNCVDVERESYRRREMISNEAVERLSQRISLARKRRRIIIFQTEKEMEQSTSSNSGRGEVLLFPPRSGTDWIGFTDPSLLMRFYIRLRSTEKTKSAGGSCGIDKRSRDSFKLGFTEKVLNSGCDFEIPEVPDVLENEPPIIQDKLWVEKYAPRSYADLISDEAVNRLLLNWVRLWDECVFQRAVPDMMFRGASNQQQLMLNNERPKRPFHKVVLMAGPAGAGKTTLATLVAQHAGYRVVGLNASDERNIADFEKCFEDALRTTRTLDAGSKPNCLILDEIDGAPVQSIHYLCQAIAATGRRSLRRPVICICNNLYTPSLRELRSIALVIQLPRTDGKRLAKRLEEISAAEHLKVESSALSEIIDACSRDLRSSLNALQFIASESRGSIKRQAILKFCEREKQFGEKSLFDSWASVFELSRHLDANGRILGADSRMKRIAFLSEQHSSESDRFYMGLFTNYLNSKNASLLSNTSMAIRQFCYYDQLVTVMNSVQDYSLLKYLPAVCVGIHLLLSCRGRVQLNFPSEHQNAVQRYQQSFEIAESVRAGAKQRSISLSAIALEILPYLVSIVQPDLKPMNAHLYSARELSILRWIVSVMRSYSLTYNSVSQDGSINFTFKPAIEQLVMFADEDASSSSKRSTNSLSNTARQLIAHEIEMDKLRSVDVVSDPAGGDSLQAVSLDEFRTKKSKLSRGGVTFCFCQGSSSAIKRSIKMKNLFAL